MYPLWLVDFLLELNYTKKKKNMEEGCITMLLQRVWRGGKAHLLLTGFAVTKPPEPSTATHVVNVELEVLQQCATLQQIRLSETEMNFKRNSFADIG